VDTHLRQLERQAALGDSDASLRHGRELCRAGIHQFETTCKCLSFVLTERQQLVYKVRGKQLLHDFLVFNYTTDVLTYTLSIDTLREKSTVTFRGILPPNSNYRWYLMNYFTQFPSEINCHIDGGEFHLSYGTVVIGLAGIDPCNRCDAEPLDW